MKKHEFLAKLETELAKLSDRDEIIAYYEELINEGLSNGEPEEEFIKHLGTPSEIKFKLTRDEHFKENIKTKQNVSARQTVTTVVKVLSKVLSILGAIVLFAIGLGLVVGGVTAVFASIYHLAVDTIKATVILYYVFTIIFAVTLAIFGIFVFIYLFKFFKRQAEKLQIFLADKLNKGGTEA